MTHTADRIIQRNAVQVLGDREKPVLMFGHGYGCGQTMWHRVIQPFLETHCVVLFDYVGSGRSDLSAYDRSRYDSLHGYATDVVEVIDSLGLSGITFVGHSVSGMIGALAAIERPDAFAQLVLVGASPRYVDDPTEYAGGFSREDVDQLLDAIDSNYLGWAESMAPALMGTPDRPELADELHSHFAGTNVDVAKQFARVTFLSDMRRYLPLVTTPTLIVQSPNDFIAPLPVGEYLRDHLAGSELKVLEFNGHYAHVSSPDELVSCIASVA
ncbi:alpha/beta fold hydrolase [Lysinibacter cavernae]|uniref:Sigma-B regulation protein RsbQ n=1 Tax=Lysinibacter cavernae TaxID=1640652 RepID=A0A7X5R157_9MICO|nr:alpha/beta hydrolase [Lysinibacter cavernae]NIH53790.1 sigma-B regulation protein RsbQ [Lysinibacter cavernae]